MVVPNLLVGCCGWSYKDDWKPNFYPESLKQTNFLEFYSQVFPTVEIDSSFYRIPSKKIVEGWNNKTPPDFLFSGKLPQEITHKNMLKLDQIKEYFTTYVEAVSELERAGKMIAHLVQLPPSFSLDESLSALEDFLNFWVGWRETSGKQMIGSSFSKKSWRLVVEFRNTSWMTEKTFEILRKYSVSYCAVVEPLLPPRMDLTCDDLFYLRFHGFGKNPWFNYLFSNDELVKWAKEIQKVIEMSPRALHVAYFNNHFSGNAVKNALDIMPKLGIRPLKDPLEISMPYSQKTRKNPNLTNDSKKDITGSLDKWMKK